MTKTDKDVPVENSLPLVTIRDPYVWMQSMCRHRYAAYGDWKTPSHCPNILKENVDVNDHDYDNNNNTIPASVHYSETEPFITYHKSLPHLWNDWYRLYYNATFPRIIVRFEDLLFYGQQVTEALCKCGGGVTREDRRYPHFVHVSESAKLGTAAHGKHKTGLVGALIKYSTFKHRLDSLSAEDIQAAVHIFDSEIMDTFGYTNPILP